MTLFHVGTYIPRTHPGRHRVLPAYGREPQVVFTVRGVSGATPSASTLTVTMPTRTYAPPDRCGTPIIVVT